MERQIVCYRSSLRSQEEAFMTTSTRRQFLQRVTLGSAAALVTSRPHPLEARQAVDATRWRSRIGLELYTVRDLLMADYEGTLIAGIDPIALVKAHPGRFELWHIKDVFGLKTVNASLGPNARVSSMALVPVGTGHIDFEPVFAHASLAGLKHFVVEQDNAAHWGDSLAAARVSYQSLAGMLT
jgi:hypothetical protein